MVGTAVRGWGAAVTALVVVGVGLCLAPAQAAGQWSASADLFTEEVTSIAPDASRSRLALQVRTDPQGNAVAAWVQIVGTACQGMWASRPFGGRWSATQPLADAEGCVSPGLALVMNRKGKAVVAWTQGTGIATATRAAGGSFGAAQPVVTGVLSDSPALAMNETGTVAVAWVEHGVALGQPDPLKARVRPAGGAWSAVETLTATDSSYAPSLAMDSSGNVTAAWSHAQTVNIFTGESNFSVQTAYRQTGGSFPLSPSQTLDAWTSTVGSGAEIAPDLGIDDNGRVSAVWLRDTGTQRVVRWASKVAQSDTFGALNTINGSDSGNARYPRIAVDRATNAAVAVWQQCTASCVIRSARRPSGGVFGSLQTISGSLPTTGVYGPAIAPTPSGGNIATWSGAPGGSGSDRVAAATRPAGGQFEAPVFISGDQAAPDESGPALAVDGRGNAVVVWAHSVATPAAFVRYADYLAWWYQPDGMIKKASATKYAGARVYNTTGARQIISAKARRSRSATFYLKVVNRSSTYDTISVKGTGGRPGFRVKYLKGSSGTKDITTAIKAGNYHFLLAAGRSTVFRLVVTAKAGAPIGSANFWSVTSTSQHDPTRQDTVKASVTIAP